MIVRENDSCAAVTHGVGYDLADGKWTTGLVAVVAGHVKAVCFFVDMSDPQLLPARIAFFQASREKRAGSREAIELQGLFGTLIPHCA